MNKQTKTILIEVVKTSAGVVLGRTAVVFGEKALKVHEETDPKKKKMKEIGVGLAVAGAGAFGAMKLDDSLKSVAAGVTTAGLISAASPFGKEDAGFIPVLRGADEDYYEDDFEDFDELEDDEFENEMNALDAIEYDTEEGIAHTVSSELN